MGKKPKIPEKLKRWVEARQRHRLSHAQIQMARELGMNPKKFGKLDNHDQERWKMPLGQFIEECYRKASAGCRQLYLASSSGPSRGKETGGTTQAKAAKRQADALRRLVRRWSQMRAAWWFAKSILDDIPANLPEELFTTILRADYVRIKPGSFPRAMRLRLDSGTTRRTTSGCWSWRETPRYR